jgi:uncharacterized protein YwgA
MIMGNHSDTNTTLEKLEDAMFEVSHQQARIENLRALLNQNWTVEKRLRLEIASMSQEQARSIEHLESLTTIDDLSTLKRKLTHVVSQMKNGQK